MDITELVTALDLLRPMFPDVRWDSDDDGNIVLLTYQTLEVGGDVLTNDEQSRMCIPKTIGGVTRA